jgi:lysophospholipase L1-like esterase
MNIAFTPKSRLLTGFIIFLAVIAGIYLNRAYTHIYDIIGAADLPSVNQRESYIINNNMNSSNIVYVALGDSLSSGVGTDRVGDSFPYLLAKKMSGAGEIILHNRAIPGEETASLISDLLPLAVDDKPDVVTLLIGVNDIHNFTSARDFQENYNKILERLTKETTAKIYVINIPFLGADTLMLPPYQAAFDLRTKEFNSIIKELAAKYSINYVDLYTPTVSQFKKSGDHYSVDLFHPSAAGYKIWADIIYAGFNK